MDDVFKFCEKSKYFSLYYNLDCNSEVCPRYHFFVAACILGSIINRKVSFQRGSPENFPTLYPNPWVVLVGPQGLGHKSSSIWMGGQLLSGLPDHLKPKILASKITPEALIKALASQIPQPGLELPKHIPKTFFQQPAIGLLKSTELSVLLGKERYNIGLSSLLTELYDCHDKWVSETIMRGDQALYNICLSFLGASTPEGIQTLLPQDLFKTGLMSRIILIALPPNWNKRVACPPPAPPGLRDEILSELEKLALIHGKINWTPECEALFTNWYEGLGEREVAPGPVIAYLERKQDHLLKLAILLQLTYTQDELVLEAQTLQDALNILNLVEPDTIKVIESLVTDPRMRVTQMVIDLFRVHKILPESVILNSIMRYLNHPKDFEAILGLLLKAKIIKIKSVLKEEIIYEHIEK